MAFVTSFSSSSLSHSWCSPPDPFLFRSIPSMASITASSFAISSLSSSCKPNKACLKTSSLSFKGISFPSLRLNQATCRFSINCAAKPETVDKVCEIVKKQLALPGDSVVNGESKFAALGADSLDTVEIVMGLEEAFGITVEEENAQSIATVQDAANLIEDLVAKKC